MLYLPQDTTLDTFVTGDCRDCISSFTRLAVIGGCWLNMELDSLPPLVGRWRFPSALCLAVFPGRIFACVPPRPGFRGFLSSVSLGPLFLLRYFYLPLARAISFSSV